VNIVPIWSVIYYARQEHFEEKTGNIELIPQEGLDFRVLHIQIRGQAETPGSREQGLLETKEAAFEVCRREFELLFEPAEDEVRVLDTDAALGQEVLMRLKWSLWRRATAIAMTCLPPRISKPGLLSSHVLFVPASMIIALSPHLRTGGAPRRMMAARC
jgi:hypothetical protein